MQTSLKPLGSFSVSKGCYQRAQTKMPLGATDPQPIRATKHVRKRATASNQLIRLLVQHNTQTFGTTNTAFLSNVNLVCDNPDKVFYETLPQISEDTLTVFLLFL